MKRTTTTTAAAAPAAPPRIADLLAVPAEAEALREAITAAELIGIEAGNAIERLNGERSAALLSDDPDGALDRIEAELTAARRRQDAADLASAELGERLTAVRDEDVRQARAEAEAALVAVCRERLDAACRIDALLADLDAEVGRWRGLGQRAYGLLVGGGLGERFSSPASLIEDFYLRMAVPARLALLLGLTTPARQPGGLGLADRDYAAAVVHGVDRSAPAPRALPPPPGGPGDPMFDMLKEAGDVADAARAAQRKVVNQADTRGRRAAEPMGSAA